MTTITAIICADQTNPIEVQAWIMANPTIQPLFMFLQSNIFYIVY